MARISPLDAPFAADVGVQLASMMPAGMRPIGLFRTFAKNLPMTVAMSEWGRYQLGRRLSLTTREREIVIIRTCARCGCEYEWGVHLMLFARRAGLTGGEVASLTRGSPDDTCWTTDRERVLIRVVDALHDSSDIEDELWRSAEDVLEEPQLLDLLLLCGWYHAISFVARAARVEPEPGAPRFASIPDG
jgi:alkylhydroperoxidase family enzyme